MRAPSLLQILILVLIIVLLFGAKRLPELARSVGQSLKIFKKEVTELRDDDTDVGTASTQAAPPPAPASPPAGQHGAPPGTGRPVDPGAARPQQAPSGTSPEPPAEGGSTPGA